MINKSGLREIIKARIRAMTNEEKISESLSITNQIVRHPYYVESKNIGIYKHLPDEVITDYLIKQAIEDNKTIFYPEIIDRKAKRMEMVTIEGNTSDKIGLLIVPGRAFDKSRNRLGRGGGYYDRYLGRYSLIKTIGICFGCQIVDEIPVNKYDKRMDIVIALI